MVNIRISEPDPNEDREFPAIDQHREEAKEMPGQHLNPLATQPGEYIDFGDAEDAIQEITDEAQWLDDLKIKAQEYDDFQKHTDRLMVELKTMALVAYNLGAIPLGQWVALGPCQVFISETPKGELVAIIGLIDQF